MAFKLNPFTGRLDRVEATEGSGSSTEIRANSHTLAAGTHSIVFTSVFTSSYQLMVQCYSGETQVPYSISSRTAEGFQVTVTDECTFSYIAIPTT